MHFDSWDYSFKKLHIFETVNQSAQRYFNLVILNEGYLVKSLHTKEFKHYYKEHSNSIGPRHPFLLQRYIPKTPAVVMCSEHDMVNYSEHSR